MAARLLDHSFIIILRDLQFQLAKSIYCSEYCYVEDRQKGFCVAYLFVCKFTYIEVDLFEQNLI